jgi:hypothetical protein
LGLGRGWTLTMLLPKQFQRTKVDYTPSEG